MSPRSPKGKSAAAAQIAGAAALRDAADFAEIPIDQLPPDVNKFLDEVGDQLSKVTLYRVDRSGKQLYVATLAADEFELDAVASRWGGGRYLARLIGPEGILKGITFYIDESIKPTPEKTALATGGLDKLTELLLSKALDKTGSDPAAMAAAMAQASAAQMTAMMTAMGPLLAKITELASGSGKAGGGTASELFEAINLGLELSGDRGKPDGFLAAVEKVGVPMVKIAGDALALQRARQKFGRVNPPAGTAPEHPETKGGEEMGGLPAGVPAWVLLVKPYVATIVEFAARREDPEVLAIGLEQQSPRIVDWLDKKVTDAEFRPALYANFPALDVHKEWVERFLAEFGPEDEPSAEEHDDDGTQG